MNNDVGDVLPKLIRLLQERKNADPKDSYVADLYAQGLNAILQKVGEEAIELIIATKSNQKSAIIHEVADLLFHTLVLLVELGVQPDEIITELQRRWGQSGHEEKAAR